MFFIVLFKTTHSRKQLDKVLKKSFVNFYFWGITLNHWITWSLVNNLTIIFWLPLIRKHLVAFKSKAYVARQSPFNQNFSIFLVIFTFLDHFSVYSMVFISLWPILMGFFFEVLQKSRNPRWRTKMAAAQNDDVISTSCDVINSFCGLQRNQFSMYYLHPTFHCHSCNAMLKRAESARTPHAQDWKKENPFLNYWKEQYRPGALRESRGAKKVTKREHCWLYPRHLMRGEESGDSTPR